MRRRHPIPRTWLMTDERLGDKLWDAIARLPRGSGVVFRHHGLPAAERQRLLSRVRRLCVRRGLVLLGSGGLPGPDGVHNGRRTRAGLNSRSAHNRREAIAAERAGADLIFVSPVYATRSHPGAQTLGRVGLGKVIRGLRVPVIALGGMTPERFRSLRGLGICGWAAIDAWMRGK